MFKGCHECGGDNQNGKDCGSCDKFFCSSHLPQDYQNGKNCVSCHKFFCSSHGKDCGSCDKFFCSSHLTQKYKKGKYCGSCDKFFCSSHLPQNGKDCRSCDKFFCSSHLPQNYQKENNCGSCGKFFCSLHKSEKCNFCNQIFCESHIQKCTCGKLYCKNDNGHYSQQITGTYGIQLFCLNGAENGKYEGQFSRNQSRHGFGVCTWPSGLKTLRQYENNILVSEQNYSLEEQANHLVQEKMRKWEETKKSKEKQLEAEFQNRKNTFEKETSEKLKAIELEEKKRKEEIELEDKTRREEIKQEQQKLERLRIEFEEEKRKMEKFERAQDSWVKLNVGGSRFETSVTTLTKCEFFNSMFSGRYQTKKNEEGDIIVRIDRDGTHFSHILKFLRDGKLEKLPPSVVQDLIVEAEYYGLSGLVDNLK